MLKSNKDWRMSGSLTAVLLIVSAKMNASYVWPHVYGVHYVFHAICRFFCKVGFVRGWLTNSFLMRWQNQNWKDWLRTWEGWNRLWTILLKNKAHKLFEDMLLYSLLFQLSKKLSHYWRCLCVALSVMEVGFTLCG